VQCTSSERTCVVLYCIVTTPYSYYLLKQAKEDVTEIRAPFFVYLLKVLVPRPQPHTRRGSSREEGVTRTMSDTEETLKRLMSHKGVKGILILNSEGVPIRSNLNQEDTDTYAALISQLNLKVGGVWSLC
jgi:hypothetical protein